MHYKLDKYKIEFYNNFPLSLEDRIRNLIGDVCFYNGSGRKGIKNWEFYKRFKRQIKLMEQFIKQEKTSPQRKTYTRQIPEMSNIAKHYPMPGYPLHRFGLLSSF